MYKLIKFIVVLVVLCFSLFGLAVPASADQVYHTERLELKPVDDAPLRSGFVVNIHSNGPINYAHEVYELNGAAANTSYQVVLNAYLGSTLCEGTADLVLPTAIVTTNIGGNGKADFFLPPEGVAGLNGLVIGVQWQVWNGATLDYQTRCTQVTLD